MARKHRFFDKRNGADALSVSLLVFSLVFVAVILICNGRYLTLLALVPIGYSIYRILSPKSTRREAENEAYLSVLRRIGGHFRLLRGKIRDRKTHIFFRCGCCNRYIRVCRGLGEIDVTCPNCHTVSRLQTGEKQSKEGQEKKEGKTVAGK